MRALGEAWMTIYTDNVIRKGKNGDWYLKRGYYAGMFNETREEFKHLLVSLLVGLIIDYW